MSLLSIHIRSPQQPIIKFISLIRYCKTTKDHLVCYLCDVLSGAQPLRFSGAVCVGTSWQGRRSIRTSSTGLQLHHNVICSLSFRCTSAASSHIRLFPGFLYEYEQARPLRPVLAHIWTRNRSQVSCSNSHTRLKPTHHTNSSSHSQNTPHHPLFRRYNTSQYSSLPLILSLYS